MDALVAAAFTVAACSITYAVIDTAALYYRVTRGR